MANEPLFAQIEVETLYGTMRVEIASRTSMSFNSEAVTVDGKTYHFALINITLDPKLGWRYPVHTISIGDNVRSPMFLQQMYVTEHVANVLVVEILRQAERIVQEYPKVMAQVNLADMRRQVFYQKQVISDLKERVKDEQQKLLGLELDEQEAYRNTIDMTGVS